MLLACGVGLAVLLSCPGALGQGRLETLRTDVRTDPPPSSSPSAPRRSDPPEREDDYHYDSDRGWHRPSDHDAGTWLLLGAVLGGTSPFWGPPVALQDHYSVPAYFPRFPYDRTRGYMVSPEWPGEDDLDGSLRLSLDELCAEACGESVNHRSPQPRGFRARRWAARIRADYADGFGDPDRIGGHLLLSTTSRFGLDTEMSFLQEDLPGDRYDELWIGDCNVIFRFAQSPHMQWRTGLGFNWLDDPFQTDFGFNFTYGMDWFPRKPWVVSAELDWGTLGRAELFHFRTTVGAVIHGVEAYAGYEYYDIDRTQINNLIAGVRLWF